MASNVFGDPITIGTRSERVEKALKDPDAGKKQDKANTYVQSEKGSFGDAICTLGIFYNATGVVLTKGTEHDYDGKVWDTYPLEVQNGQWGAFLHGNKANPSGASLAYVTYDVEGHNRQICTALIGWDTDKDKNSPSDDNHAYCAIYNKGAKPDDDTIVNEINQSAKETSCKYKGISLDVKIGAGDSPILTANFNYAKNA